MIAVFDARADGEPVILNGYAVLAAFLSVVQGLIALCALGAAAKALWGVRLTDSEGQVGRTKLEERGYLAVTAAVALLGVSLASWPLLFLLLQSYVPEWRGVMCVYGVMQIGAGSLGSSGYLPLLARAVQISKPAIVFVGGCCYVLYRINRATRNGSLLRRVLAGICCLGVLSLIDSALELSYLVIDKKGAHLSVGCCTVAFDDATWDGSGTRARELTMAYYATNLLLIAILGGCVRRAAVLPRSAVAVVFVACLGSAFVSARYLIDVAAPVLLKLPFHHCPYDLIAKAPESTIGVALFVLGLFSVGWSFVAVCFGRGPVAEEALHREVRTLLALALFGYCGSILLLSVELTLV